MTQPWWRNWFYSKVLAFGVQWNVLGRKVFIPCVVRAAVLISLALFIIGCGGHVPRPPVELGTVNLGSVLTCTPWTEPEKKRAGIGESGEPAPELRGFQEIGVVIHLMSAHIEEWRRKKEYIIDRAWALAPVDNALRMKLTNVFPGQRDAKIEFWTVRMIRKFFSNDEGRDGTVNQILSEAFLSKDKDEKTGETWMGPGIRLALLGGEDCIYSPRTLRPDGLARDSIPTPYTSIPWTNQLFRSISRLFTNGNPHVLHVFLWWSVGELEIDGVDAVKGGRQIGDRVWGYSRSTARGGPAVWVGAYQCLKHPRLTDPDEPSIGFWHGRCAKVIAHEVGHALGLHHVEDGFEGNLMFVEPVDKYFSEQDKGVSLSVEQKQQMVGEAREQFGTR